jgi:hypothetical protein
MITDKQIENAIRDAGKEDGLHKHPDCIRIAYEWLDAQKKTKLPRKSHRALKHLIERWAGRYVSQSDVEVAAHMHPAITGVYPSFNISSRLTEPSLSRLEGMLEPSTHHYQPDHKKTAYSYHEGE